MKTHHVGLAIGVGTLFSPQVLVTENVLHIWNLSKLFVVIIGVLE